MQKKEGFSVSKQNFFLPIFTILMITALDAFVIYNVFNCKHAIANMQLQATHIYCTVHALNINLYLANLWQQILLIIPDLSEHGSE